MTITDTHVHLYSDAFAEDREKLIQEAMSQGIRRFFLPAIDSGSSEEMIKLKHQYPQNIFLMAGLHPTQVKEDYQKELQFVLDTLNNEKIVAVGEIGIDLHWDTTTLPLQQIAFKRQIQYAKERKLPIVIHCRKAFDEVFEVLEDEKDEHLRGIFHCFTGNEEQAKRALALNMKLGIGGVVTFKNGKIDRYLHRIPIKHIVLETDAPYLAPVPYRGKRNNPVYLVEVLKKVASIYQISEIETARITTFNSKEIFGV